MAIKSNMCAYFMHRYPEYYSLEDLADVIGYELGYTGDYVYKILTHHSQGSYLFWETLDNFYNLSKSDLLNFILE